MIIVAYGWIWQLNKEQFWSKCILSFPLFTKYPYRLVVIFNAYNLKLIWLALLYWSDLTHLCYLLQMPEKQNSPTFLVLIHFLQRDLSWGTENTVYCFTNACLLSLITRTSIKKEKLILWFLLHHLITVGILYPIIFFDLANASLNPRP